MPLKSTAIHSGKGAGVRRGRRRLAAFCALLPVLALGLWMIWDLSVRLVRMPLGALERESPCVCYYDAAGALVHVDRGYDYRWCFPVRYEQIPREMIRFLLAVEDRRFWEHDGVDLRAGGRAFLQMLWNGRIVSGASTITMQVMTAYTGRSRTLSYKVRQMLLAWQWERSHTKEEILERYFNLLPYGGKLYGIEAAAQYYFGRHAWELNRGEMVLLAGLPQGPEWYRPDRYPDAALRRRETVLYLLVRNGALTEEEAREVRQEPLRYRRFETPCWPRMVDTHFLSTARAARPGRTEYHLSLDSQLQQEVLWTLRAGQATLPQVRDAAAVVVENATGKVRACVGTLDFAEPRTGAVDASRAWRSPGSAWKPFLYGEAIHGGLLCQDTKVLDAPLALRDYRPGNYDGDFRGWVPASRTLADSLNTPAVRILRQLGVPRFQALLQGMGLLRTPRRTVAPGESFYGLSLAIGGGESTLVGLTAAYARLADAPPELHWLEDDEIVEEVALPPRTPLWNRGVRQMVLKMLRTNPLPCAPQWDVAWKTGTSQGNRDAWCFAVTPKWTVGVWYGNKDGTASPALVGVAAAAPAAGAILQLLCGDDPPQWPPEDTGAPAGEAPLWEKRALCARSGLAPSRFCQELQEGTAVVGIPLAPCTLCKAAKTGETFAGTLFLEPAPGDYHLLPGQDALEFTLRFRPAEAHLYVDGEYRGLQKTGEKISLPPGIHSLLLWNPGNDGSATLKLGVR